MSFVNPSLLVFLIIVPVVVLFLVWRGRARLAALRRIGDAELTRVLAPQVSRSRRFWKAAFWIGSLGALIFALARPVWGVNLDVIETQGVAVMVVLDVSNSMEAEDVVPNRLERAKLTIRDLFERLEGNEIGLILFAGTAFVQFPLTTDTTSATSFLNAASTSAISRQGTAIESALRLAMDSFDDESPAARIIVLVTDGENHEGDTFSAVRDAADSGITIHVIGYGDPVEGAPVPVRDDAGNVVGYKSDRGGNVIFSRLDEPTLQSIADLTEGLYQRASANGIEIVNIVNRVNEAQTGSLESRTERRGVERFAIFVALALLALSVEILLPETKGEMA
jgi:Ca-activated chloride channel homolog